MPINEQHLLGLLGDILKNHTSQQYLSADEQRQIKQLSNQLLQLGLSDQQLINTLETIQNSNQFHSNENIQQWISVIDDFS